VLSVSVVAHTKSLCQSSQFITVIWQSRFLFAILLRFFGMSLYFSAEKCDVESRLASAQKALLMQEDALRDLERDRKQVGEKISALDRSLAISDAKKSKLQV
jgi:hypothetical protein